MNILQSLSIIIAAFVAVYSINAWRRELKGQRELDVSEQALALIYECKDNLQFIRNIYSFGGEGQTRKHGPKETEEESEALDRAYVLFERYEKVKDSFIKLQSIKYKFMAIFGKETAEPFNEVNRIMNELFLAAKRLGSRYWNPRYQGQLERDPKWEKKILEYEAKFYSGGESDIFAERMDNVVRRIEDICSKIIQGKKAKKKTH
ncbi:hypothetical protein ES705_17050 [subsurface metagenome]